MFGNPAVLGILAVFGTMLGTSAGLGTSKSACMHILLDMLLIMVLYIQELHGVNFLMI